MKNLILHALLSTTALVAATPSLAQSEPAAPVVGSPAAPVSQPVSAGDDASQATEIVVTANKRVERLQDVPQTVNVVDAKQLNNLNIRQFQDIQTTVAGLSLSRNSGNEQSISLRGVKMPSFAGAATNNTVETYLDEVPIRVTDVFNSIYDVGQIEVLRGPQGTLRGRTSPSGAILVGTAKPDFDAVQGYVDGTITNLRGRNIQGALNLPVGDTLAVRVAGLYDHNRGNNVRNIVNGDRSNNETGSGRITVAWRPTSNLHIEAMHQELHSDGGTYRSLDGVGTAATRSPGLALRYDDRIALNPGNNEEISDLSFTSLNARLDLGSNRLSYIGGYQKSKFSGSFSNNYSNSIGVVPDQITLTWNSKLLTQELRFESVTHSFWNYVFGGYYDHDDKTMLVNVPSIGVNRRTPSTTRNIGLFTDQRFSLTSRDVFEVGLRYNDVEQKTATQTVTYKALTGNASIKHNFTRDMMVYANYGRSFRPGSGNTISPAVPIPAALVNFGKETSNSFEVGAKSSFLDGKLQVDVDAFYQKYTGYVGQNFNLACTGTPSTTGPGFATYDGTPAGVSCTVGPNANGNAVSKGFELEVRGRPLPGWTLQGTISYAKANYDNAAIPCNDYNGDGTPDSNGVPRVQAGKYVSVCNVNTDLGQLPRFSLAGTTGYEHDLGKLTGFVRAQVTYQTKAFFPANQYTVKGYGLVNLFAGARGIGSGWEAQLFVKNLFNVATIDTYGGRFFAAGRDTGYSIGTVLKPREVGLNLRYSFGS